MVICPNCLKKISEGAQVCDECGYVLDQSGIKPQELPQYDEMTSTDTDDEIIGYDEAYQASLVEEHHEDEYYLEIDDSDDDLPYDRLKKKHKNPRKIRRFNLKKTIKIACLSLVGVIALGACAVGISALVKSLKPLEYTAYFANGKLVVNNHNSGVATTTSITSASDGFNNLCRITEDGKSMFYPDGYRTGDTYINLYYQDLTKAKATPKKIANNVVSYSVSKDGKYVTALTNKNVLCYYSVETGKNVVLSQDVTYFEPSEDNGSRIYFNHGDRFKMFDGKNLIVVANRARLEWVSGKNAYYSVENDGYRDLYFYNGKEGTLVLEKFYFLSTEIEELDTAIVAAYSETDESVYHHYVYKDKNERLVIYNYENFKTAHWIDEDGKTLYYLDEVDEPAPGDKAGYSEALLYKLELSKNGIKKRTEVDEDVNFGQFVAPGKFVYVKNYDTTHMDIYMDGNAICNGAKYVSGIIKNDLVFVAGYDNLYRGNNKVAAKVDDVYVFGNNIAYLDSYLLLNVVDGAALKDVYRVIVCDDKLYCLTQFNSVKKCGTLMVYENGSFVKITDDVFDVYIYGEDQLTYIKDLDSTGRADLYRFDGKVETRIAKDVVQCQSYFQTTDESNFVVVSRLSN